MTNVEFTARTSLRKAVLDTMGADQGGTMFDFPTANAVVDMDRGVVLVVTEPEPAIDDWDSICSLLALSGYDNNSGGQFAQDPGEPQELAGLAAWSLSLRLPVS